MRYDAQIVVRCSKQLRRTIKDWCKKHHRKEGEVTRKVLERAFGVEEEPMPLPPGVIQIQPTQGTPQARNGV